MNRKAVFSTLHISFKWFIVFVFFQFINSYTLQGQAFSPGNLAVLRIGNGTTTLSSKADVDSIFEYTTSGTPTGSKVGLPYTGASALTNSGIANSEGLMEMSAERDLLIIAGYNADSGTANVVGTSAATVNRVLYKVPSSGVPTQVAMTGTNYSGNNIRSGTSSGTHYFGSGTAPGLTLNAVTQLSTAVTDTRAIQIFNGQTYFSSDAGTYLGVCSLGTGIPTTGGQPATLLNSGAPLTNAYGFSISPDGNTLYIASDSAGILKYTKSGSVYNAAYVLNGAKSRGIVVDYSGTHPIIYATTATSTGPNAIIKITDTGSTTTAITIATSPTNTIFRGITFSPSCYASIAVTGLSTFCSGGSTSLTITGNPTATVTYNINGGAPLPATIGNNGKVVLMTGTLTDTTTYNLVSITTPSCLSVALTGSAVINVNPLPTGIAGAGNVCAGSDTTLTDVSVGGSWASSNTSVATIGSGSGILGGMAAGTATITYTLPTGCATTTMVTINPLPSAITGAGALCTDSTLTVGDPTGGGAWGSSNTGIATVGSTSGIVTGVSAGTATITYRTVYGCIATTAININPLPPTIAGVADLCAGSDTTFSDPDAGGNWVSGNTAVAAIGATSGMLSGIAKGTSIITYTLATGCATTAMVTINPLPAPIMGTGVLCADSTIAESDDSTGGTWASSNTSIAVINTVSGITSGIAAGTATITYATVNGCTATTLLTVNPLPPAITGITGVCAGAVATLSDPGTGGAWASGNTAVATISTGSGMYNGLAQGTSTITYTLPTGCAITTTVLVNPLPPAITGASAVCAGSMITLSDASGGGTWASSNTTVATIGSATGTLTGVAAGTTAITYTLGTGCAISTTVTINPLPPAVSGTTNICAGMSTLYSDPTTGGSWSSSNTGIAMVGSGTGMVSGISGGTATITYTLPTGCVATSTVNVNPLPPAITGSVNICAGATASLGDSGGGTWSSSNTSVATIGSGSGLVTGVATGTAMVTYMLGTGCTATIIATVNPSPGTITGSTGICTGSEETLTDAVPGGTWSSSNAGVATIGSSSGYFSGISAGSTVVSYALSTGCGTSLVMAIYSLPAAISGSVDVCDGSLVTLTDAGGGVWSSGNAGVATIGSASGIVRAITPGTASITYTLAAGCATTRTEIVNPLPPAISGIANICVGMTSNLSDGGGGVWSSAATTVLVGSATGEIIGIAAGTASITYTLATGCMATAIATVNPLPGGVGGPLSACAGATVSLTDGVGGTWNSSNTSIATIGSESGIVNGITQGTATISYRLATGCVTAITFTVNPVPPAITGIKSVCQGLSNTLGNTLTGGTWGSSDAGVATVAAGMVVGVSAGTATITYTSGAGCITTTIETVNPTPAAIIGLTEVCEGLDITLSDTGGGTWSSGNSSIALVGPASGIVSGMAVGSAVITYQLGTGCLTTIHITVDPLPLAITGTDSICAGATTDLMDASAGGTWMSGNPGVVSAGTSSGIITGITAGNAVLSYVLPTGCLATTTITVNPLPAAITGSLSVCLGHATNLSDSLSGGAWSSNDTGIATIGALSGLVTGAMSGTAIITYRLNTGCITNAAISVNPLPSAIGGIKSLCVGNVTSLTDSSRGNWASSNNAIATAGSATGIVTGISAGTVTITYAPGAGCFATTAVTVNPLPAAIAGDTDICVHTPVTLTDPSPSGTWSSSAPAIATIVSGSGLITGIATGTTTITYTLSTGCLTTTMITVKPLPVAGTITGSTGVCLGSSVTLADATPGGTWGTSNALIASISNAGVVTGVGAGTDTVKYSVGNSCGTAVAKINIDVYPAPGVIQITTHPDTSLCANTQYQNFGTNLPEPAGIPYFWSATDAAIFAVSAGGQYCLINFEQPGIAIIKLTAGVPGSGCTSTDSIIYHVGTGVSPEINVVYYNPEFVCTDNTASGYQWGYDDVATLDSTLLPNEINENYYNAAPDFLNKNYWVITDHGGCQQKSYYNAPLQVNNVVAHNNTGVTVFPNPADTRININVAGISTPGETEVTLYDMLGRKMGVPLVPGGSGSIDISGLKPGVYLAVVNRNGVKLGYATFVKQ